MDQIETKALPIGEALYLRYELLFIFDNVTSHAIYAKDVLQVVFMNKEPNSQQLFICTDGYKRIGGEIIMQEMCLLSKNPELCQLTKIQKVI